MNFSYFRKIGYDLQQHGHSYILADILFKIFSFLICAPFIGWIFARLITFSGDHAISNTDIIHFVLSPIGLFALFFMATMILCLFFAEHALLIAIALSAQQKQAINWLSAFILLKNKAPKLVVVGATYIITLTLLALPLLLIIGGLYLKYLTQFDINYYLQQMPAEFIKFLVISTPLVLILMGIFTYLYVTWLCSIPMILFEEQASLLSFLKNGLKRIKGYWWHSAKALLLWWFILGFCFLSMQALVGDGLSALLFTLSAQNTTMVLASIGLIFLLILILHIAWQVLTTTGSSIIVAHLYKEQAQKYHINMQPPLGLQKDKKGKDFLKWGIFFGLLGLVVTSALMTYAIVGSLNFNDHSLIIAHKGAPAKAPSNSRSAILEAIDMKADMVELDVQETADGMVIVHHDKDYMLTSQISKAVHELDYATTKDISIGQSFSSEFANEKVMSLKEALQTAKGKVKLLIELKYYGYDQNLAQRVLDLVHHENMEDQVQYMSLNLEKIKELKKLEPNAQIGYIASAATLGNLGKIDVDFLALSSSFSQRTIINALNLPHKKVYVWTVDNIAVMNNFLDYQVDGIITNEVVTLQRLINQRGQMSKAERIISLFHTYWDK
ncbi:MAG: glycerophosphodiester phosphodiesterase family protein [Alphaproteobacteria bacterium]